MDSYKNVRRIYREKSAFLSTISDDLENLRKDNDPLLKRYIEITSFLTANGLNIDIVLNSEDDAFSEFVKISKEAKELMQMSSLVRQYVALKEYGRMLVYETKHLEDVLLQVEGNEENSILVK